MISAMNPALPAVSGPGLVPGRRAFGRRTLAFAALAGAVVTLAVLAGRGFLTDDPSAFRLVAASAGFAPGATPLMRGDAAGGGYADAGLNGEYFATPNLAGTPAFTRRDVRLDFDWGERSPGGSPAEPYRSFPAQNFSVRWTGHLLPRFSETYTFRADADGSLRVAVQAPGAATWTPVIRQGHTGRYRFAAGQEYGIRVEYHHRTGPGGMHLAWSSPSVPAEIIEPAGGLASNAYTEGFTDAMRTGRDEWKWVAKGGPTNDNAPRDPNGWPRSDAACMVWEGTSGHQGTYLLQFHGKADPDVQFGYGKFSGQTYDPATNTTTATMTVTDTGMENFTLIFKNTYRDGHTGPGTGVTDVRLLTPTAPGAPTPFPAGSLFRPDLKNSLRRYVALRFMAGTNWNNSVAWSDRTRPVYSTQHFTRPGESGFEGNGMAWEYRVALCNETGKDLYVNVPETAGDDYVTKLAQLIRYGSDGVNPYTAPQTHPVYPPLNSNLCVYVENANEVWNYGFAAWRQNFDAAQAAVKNNTPEGKILTYDGNTDANVGWNRRYALRTVQISNLFRGVFGDAAMGHLVRPLLEWQYDNAGWPPTASTELTFLDDYFHNADGKAHVPTPHPLSYYLWGGGGAAYYNAQNEEGLTGVLPVNAPAQNLAAATTVSVPLTVPTGGEANVYAVRFRARVSGAAGETFDVYLDNQKISHAGSWQGFYQPGNDWQTFNTDTFTAAPGSSHTLRFVGLGKDAGAGVTLDSVTLTSVDAIFAADIPASGNGNTLADYRKRLDVAFNWAHLYGLHGVSYEGGWALGGDAGGTPLQNWAKFHDPRAAQAQRRSVDAFYQAGGALYTFGTYSQQDAWDRADAEPLPQGIDVANSRLAPAPAGAVAAPGTLTQDNKLTAWGDKNVDTGSGGMLGPRTLMAWDIWAPAAGSYTLTPSAAGPVQVIVDDVPTSGPRRLSAGLHSVRLRTTTTVPVTGVTISPIAKQTARKEL